MSKVLNQGAFELFVHANQRLNSFVNFAVKDPESDQLIQKIVGFKPLESEVRGAFALSGKTPYWKLRAQDAAQSSGFNLSAVGFQSGHEVLVVAHYLDTEVGRILEKRLGPPLGVATQFALSSPRSVALITDANEVYCLKFSGRDIEALKKFSGRRLDHAKLLSTTELNRSLPRPLFMPEERGYTLDFDSEGGQSFSVLFRDLPLHEMNSERSVFLPLYAYLSVVPEKLSATLFGRYSTDRGAWLGEQLIPRFIDLICTAFDSTGLHPEVHQQNINLLSDADGIRGLFYQDSCDLLEDVLYQAVCLGLPPEKIGQRRRKYTIDCSEFPPAETEYPFNSFLSHWYRFFIEDFGLYQPSISFNLLQGLQPKTVFADRLRDVFIDRYKQFIDRCKTEPKLVQSDELRILTRPESCFFMAVNALRDLKIKSVLLPQVDQIMPLDRHQVLAQVDAYVATTVVTMTYGMSLRRLREGLRADSCRVWQLNDVAANFDIYIYQDLQNPAQFEVIAFAVFENSPPYTF